MKTTTFTFLLLLSCCQWLAGQCPTGSIAFFTQGRLVSQQPVVDGQAVEVGHLPNGMYSLKMVAGERVFVGKFIKR